MVNIGGSIIASTYLFYYYSSFCSPGGKSIFKAIYDIHTINFGPPSISLINWH